jgi:hypothetical protein
MKKIIFIFVTAALLSSCTKQSNPVTNYIYTHSDSGLVGDMVGFIDLYDTTYSSYLYGRVSGHSGATVSLDGTPFSAVSDSNGKWILKNIPAGTYNITFAKPGYALEKGISYKFLGNGTDFLGRAKLYKVPLLHPNFITRPFHDYYIYTYRDTTIVSGGGDTIQSYIKDSLFVPLGAATFTGVVLENPSYGDIQYRFIAMYLGKTDHIDPLDPNSFFYNTGPIDANGYSNPNVSADLYNFTLYRDSLYDMGFKSGDKIYAIAYVCNYTCRYVYYPDINTGKNIYTGFSPIHSDVKSFIVP